jgi:hypothetical protein
VKLIWLPSAKEHKERILSSYLDLDRYVSMLENLVISSPHTGRSVKIPVKSGKVIDCKIKSVRLDFFPPEYSIGYEKLEAVYVIGSKDITIIDIYFS